jgi:hypothetical protein
MSKWQPIETAPRDGSKVILWDSHEGVCCARYEDYAAGWRAFWGTENYIRDGSTYDFALIASHPTHWMPLPEPPGDSC